MSDSIKSENRGESSSEEPMKPNDLNNHTHLDESSSGEVKKDHGEEENKESDQVDGIDSEQDDTSQCDELLGNDEGTSEDPVKPAFVQELRACLNRSGFKWACMSTEIITNTLVVEFLGCPEEDKAEDLKSELRLVMKGKELPIKFVEFPAPWKHA
ncbi:uncharacterized protein NECHADRAFT_81181 [Fusarium vanettenii 77-13-4]|uniref:Uncharacterized protein n=1 Tax=Fusarium vanettenii (strain ATCC MYA-4622 / CBS 123669 / FGSC 9596 / NRRL 45880 / 77-13-4) TaxID=660122 RepID=C7ZHL5_FUSV7|nr:uncharacterized protein NECHADRAFT_81181 [Fusarium vanettenii 77-13-4]EEU36434.1 hypothetical protein NECHADRAFT_81181 [Fusarium vanettenii 77-13-4]